MSSWLRSAAGFARKTRRRPQDDPVERHGGERGRAESQPGREGARARSAADRQQRAGRRRRPEGQEAEDAERGLLTTGSADFHGPEHPIFNRFRAFDLYGLEPRLGPIGA